MDHYQERSENWHPFGQNDARNNIQKLVIEAFKKVEHSKSVIPQFIDIHDLNEDSNFSDLKKLRYKGCVVIVDTISMQHPKIQSLFRRTALDAFPDTLIAMAAPVRPVFDTLQQIVSVIEQRIDIEFHRRWKLEEDRKCEKVSDETEFRRWLRDQVRCLLPKEEDAPKDVRKYMYQ